MNTILRFAYNTPWWVAPLFALLVVMGIIQLRNNRAHWLRLMGAPAVFIVWGLASALASRLPAFEVLGAWTIAAALGAMLSWRYPTLRVLAVDRQRGLISLAGSAVPLLRNLSIFVLRYAIAATMAIRPDHADALGLCNLAVSGASAGYFIAWAAQFALVYRSAPAAAPATSEILTR